MSSYPPFQSFLHPRRMKRRWSLSKWPSRETTMAAIKLGASKITADTSRNRQHSDVGTRRHVNITKVRPHSELNSSKSIELQSPMPNLRNNWNPCHATHAIGVIIAIALSLSCLSVTLLGKICAASDKLTTKDASNTNAGKRSTATPSWARVGLWEKHALINMKGGGEPLINHLSNT